MNYPDPKISFEISPGIIYTAELQQRVADCRRQANDDFMAYAIGKLRREGELAPDWPVHISVTIEGNSVSWALVSNSGHRFSVSWPDCDADRRVLC